MSSATQTVIVYRSRTAEAFDNALWDGTLAPIIAAMATFIIVVYALGSLMSNMPRTSWFNKVPIKLRPTYMFIYRHGTPFLLVVSGIVTWGVFKIVFNAMI